MLSDIHLADTSSRATINLARLCETIDNVAEEAKAGNATEFVVLLLGDIFEVLKSQIWHIRELRPWDTCATKHVAAVRDIFDSILKVNVSFFETLRRVRENNSRSKIVYVPGNHDWPLNGKMGRAARTSLVAAAGLDHDPARPFPSVYTNLAHSLIASHGHEHDLANRTEEGKIALGDAIVIEVLLALPTIVGKSLGNWSEYDSRLRFLHELDNVRPQSIEAMASWLVQGTRALAVSSGQAPHSVSDALQVVTSKLQELRKATNASDAWQGGAKWIDMLMNVGALILQKTDLLSFLANYRTNESEDSYRHHAHQDLAATLRESSACFKYIAYGHTHLAEHVALGLGNASGAGPPIYFNTGTWRRVHRFVRGSSGEPLFADFEDETYVTLYAEENVADVVRRYQIRRVVHG